MDYIDKLISRLVKGMKVEIVANTYGDDNTASDITLKIPKQTIYLNNPQIRIVEDELLEISNNLPDISFQGSRNIELFPLCLYTYFDIIEEGRELPLHLTYQLTTDKIFDEWKSTMFKVECYANPL